MSTGSSGDFAGIVRFGEAAPVDRELAHAMARALGSEEVSAIGTCGWVAGRPAVRDGWTAAVCGEVTNLRPLRKEVGVRRGLPADAGPADFLASVCGEAGFERGLGRLDGDFAAMAWDGSELWLARDCAGGRPVWWAVLADGAVAFASRRRALAGAGTRLDLDPADARAVVEVGFVPPGARESGPSKLPAGHGIRIGREASYPFAHASAGACPPGRAGSGRKWAKSVRLGFELAVLRRLDEADGIAVFASGGAFSTAVLLAAAERCGDRVQSLSIGADSAPAIAVAERARVPHRSVPWKDEAVGESLDRLSGILDEPCGDPVVVAVDALLAECRDARVALCGFGGVESFGAGLASGARASLSRGLRRLSARAAREPGTALAGVAGRCPSSDPDAARMWVDRTLRLPESLLAPSVRAAASTDIALRAPLCDSALQALASTVPIGFHRGGDRPLFLAALRERLPDAVGAHQPLVVPVSAWLRGRGADRLDGLAEALDGWMGGDEVRRLADEHRATTADHGLRLWRMVALAAWRRETRDL